MLLHEAEDSRLSPQEHRGPFQNGDTESLREAGSTGRAWGGSVWKDPSVRGVRAGGGVGSPRPQGGWGAGSGREGNRAPRGQPEPFRTPFSSFLEFPREGNGAGAVATTHFILPATPTPLPASSGL